MRQGKGQSVQNYTEEFRKKELASNISLYSQENLLKYIGGFHIYIRHTIILVNPTNFDEVCVQETHIETKGTNTKEKFSKNPFKPDWNKSKGKGKGKHTSTCEEGWRKTYMYSLSEKGSWCFQMMETSLGAQAWKVSQ